jgi:hypothetical protein
MFLRSTIKFRLYIDPLDERFGAATRRAALPDFARPRDRSTWNVTSLASRGIVADRGWQDTRASVTEVDGASTFRSRRRPRL